MKVGIITIYDLNYGNRLQNYALQEVFKSLGVEAETIRTLPYFDTPFRMQDIVLNCVNLLKRLVRLTGTFKVDYFSHKSIDPFVKELFYRFEKDYMKMYSLHIAKNDIPFFLRFKYDIFCVGSDQVWNPLFGNGNKAFYLQFANKEKRISYAASFGIDSIPDKYVNRTKQYLSDMKSISVREETGKKIVFSLINRDVDVLIDPTMLLTADKWEILEKKPVGLIDEEYVFSYFLGEQSNNTQEELRCFFNEQKCRLVELNGKSLVGTFKAGPQEFLYLIHHAKYVVTDSFHGCVFSIIFKKPFSVLRRKGNEDFMFNRIETLLNKFSLQSCICDSMEHAIQNFNKPFFYSDIVDKVLHLETEKSIDFLKKALED